jgi:DNA-binding Xre family transcriptional regulator
MAIMGRNVKVDAYKIFSKIVDKYKHVHSFTEAHPEISYVTLCQLFSGKTKSLRSETVVKIASALECAASEFVIYIPKVEKVKKVDQNAENLKRLIEELGL